MSCRSGSTNPSLGQGPDLSAGRTLAYAVLPQVAPKPTSDFIAPPADLSALRSFWNKQGNCIAQCLTAQRKQRFGRPNAPEPSCLVERYSILERQLHGQPSGFRFWSENSRHRQNRQSFAFPIVRTPRQYKREAARVFLSPVKPLGKQIGAGEDLRGVKRQDDADFSLFEERS